MDGLTKFFITVSTIGVLVLIFLLTWGVEWRG